MPATAARSDVRVAPAAVPLRILLVDPSLFTAPYDAALSHGLEEAGATASWATRGLRPGEEDEIGAARRVVECYPWTDGRRRRALAPWRALKGVEHLLATRTIIRRAQAFDLVHFQWAVLPAVDAWAAARLRRTRPVVLTVHDTTPFNGKAVSSVQVDGFDRMLRAVDRLIVHTASGRDALRARGIDAARIAVVPHGLLGATGPASRPATLRGARWRIVQFGKIQHYKGVDVLVEALGRLTPAERARLSVVVAGEPLIDLAPLRARAAELGIDNATLALVPHRHTQAEMDDLLGGADAFVFPYRAIEASGVLFLVARLRRWMIASEIGAFAERIGRDGEAGTLVPPGNAAALAAALVGSVGRAPKRGIADDVPDWAEIGSMTRAVYADAQSAWRAGR